MALGLQCQLVALSMVLAFVFRIDLAMNQNFERSTYGDKYKYLWIKIQGLRYRHGKWSDVVRIHTYVHILTHAYIYVYVCMCIGVCAKYTYYCICPYPFIQTPFRIFYLESVSDLSYTNRSSRLCLYQCIWYQNNSMQQRTNLVYIANSLVVSLFLISTILVEEQQLYYSTYSWGSGLIPFHSVEYTNCISAEG